VHPAILSYQPLQHIFKCCVLRSDLFRPRQFNVESIIKHDEDDAIKSRSAARRLEPRVLPAAPVALAHPLGFAEEDSRRAPVPSHSRQSTSSKSKILRTPIPRADVAQPAHSKFTEEEIARMAAHFASQAALRVRQERQEVLICNLI
jgi:hypothetical protein